jgi:hypothetical protein
VINFIERCLNVYEPKILLSFGSDIPPNFRERKRKYWVPSPVLPPFLWLVRVLVDRSLARSLRGSLPQSPYPSPIAGRTYIHAISQRTQVLRVRHLQVSFATYIRKNLVISGIRNLHLPFISDRSCRSIDLECNGVLPLPSFLPFLTYVLAPLLDGTTLYFTPTRKLTLNPSTFWEEISLLLWFQHNVNGSRDLITLKQL